LRRSTFQGRGKEEKNRACPEEREGRLHLLKNPSTFTSYTLEKGRKGRDARPIQSNEGGRKRKKQQGHNAQAYLAMPASVRKKKKKKKRKLLLQRGKREKKSQR